MSNALNLATWHFYVDWDADGDWSDDGEDVTAYVQAASWRLGMHQPWQLTADSLTCTLTLVNADRRFSPEYSGSPLYGKLLPGRGLRIAAEYPLLLNDGVTQVVDNSGAPLDGGPVTLWTGFVAALAPAPMSHAGPFVTTLTGQGIEAFLKASALDLPLLENVTAGDIITAILARVTFPPSALGGNGWAIGLAGRSEIGQTTYIGRAAAFYALDDGLLTYAFAGDNWDRFASAYEALVGVVTAEYGQLFFDRSGKAVFWNRQRLQAQTTVQAAYADTMQGMVYSFGDGVINDARVTVYPRVLNPDSSTVLWQLDAPLTIPPKTTQQIRARYAAADGQQVGGANVTAPNTADGSFVFTPNDSLLSISDFQTDAQSATISITSRHQTKSARVTTLIVKGQKLTSWDAQEVSQINSPSIAATGRQIQRIDARLLEDTAVASAIAEWIVHERKTPRGLVRSITLMNKDNAALFEMLHRTMGDRVTVSETQTATDGTYVVVGEQHDWRDGGRTYTAVLSLEPAPSVAAWLIGIAGRGEIGQTTFIGF